MVTESRGEALNAVLNSVIRLWRLVTRATTPLIALIDDIHDQSRYVYVHMHTYTRTHTCNRQRVLMPARSSIMLIVLFKCLVLPISIIESDSCLKKIMLMHQMNYAYWSRNNPWWLSSCNVFPCFFFLSSPIRFIFYAIENLFVRIPMIFTRISASCLCDRFNVKTSASLSKRLQLPVQGISLLNTRSFVLLIITRNNRDFIEMNIISNLHGRPTSKNSFRCLAGNYISIMHNRCYVDESV